MFCPDDGVNGRLDFLLQMRFNSLVERLAQHRRSLQFLVRVMNRPKPRLRLGLLLVAYRLPMLVTLESGWVLRRMRLFV